MKIKFRWQYIFVLFCLGGTHNAASQDKGWDRFAVFKFSPSVLFEPEGGYQLGLEFPLAANFSLQVEYAHLPYSWRGLDFVFFKPHAGFYASAYKAEARFYVTDQNMNDWQSKKFLGKDIQGIYVAAQAQQKNVKSVESGTIRDSNLLSTTVYYSQQRSVFKANLKVGYQVILDHGIVIDCYAGAGYRQATIKNNPDYNLMNEPLFLYFPVNIALGMKIGMAF